MQILLHWRSASKLGQFALPPQTHSALLEHQPSGQPESLNCTSTHTQYIRIALSRRLVLQRLWAGIGGFVGTSNALDVPFIISNTVDGYATAVAFIEKDTSGASTSKEHFNPHLRTVIFLYQIHWNSSVSKTKIIWVHFTGESISVFLLKHFMLNIMLLAISL